MPRKPSFFEKLTGAVSLDDETFDHKEQTPAKSGNEWFEEENTEGQLTVDVYQTPDAMVIRTMVAGVKPEDLQISITREMVTIKGKRSKEESIINDDYFFQELYWGSFSRTILLPEEVDPDKAEANTKHGLLTIKVPKIDKKRSSTLKVKSL